jgi:hypothetical protein
MADENQDGHPCAQRGAVESPVIAGLPQRGCLLRLFSKHAEAPEPLSRHSLATTSRAAHGNLGRGIPPGVLPTTPHSTPSSPPFSPPSLVSLSCLFFPRSFLDRPRPGPTLPSLSWAIFSTPKTSSRPSLHSLEGSGQHSLPRPAWHRLHHNTLLLARDHSITGPLNHFYAFRRPEASSPPPL